MAIYERKSANEIATGEVIQASHIEDEFDQLVLAFAAATGHTHDGTTTGDGGPISKLYSNGITAGTGAASDISLTFNTSTNDGVLTWMRVEDYFKFTDDILMNSTEKIQFGDTATFIHQSADSVMTIDGEVTIDLNASTAVLVSNDLKLDSDAAVLGFGVNNDVTLTHVHDTGILLNSTMALQFNDASQYINAPSATVLDINATDEVEVNATLMDVNANLDVSGTYTGGGLMTTGGNIVIPDAGNIGSASDTDAIAIASTGVVTFSQNPVFNAGGIADSYLATISTADKVSGAAIQVDGATDGTSITVDSEDKFLIDDGGTTKYIKASQLDSYITASDVLASELGVGDGASSFTTTSGAVTIDSQAGTTTVDGHTGVTIQSTNSGNITLTSAASIALNPTGSVTVNGSTVEELAIALG